MTSLNIKLRGYAVLLGLRWCYLQLIIFDGDCLLCDFFMRYIAKRDREKVFTFVSREDLLAKEMMFLYKINEDSIFYIKEKHAFIYSDAVLEIAKDMPWPNKGLYTFKVLPKFIRDKIYILVAKYRRKFFSKTKECQIIDINIKKNTK